MIYFTHRIAVLVLILQLTFAKEIFAQNQPRQIDGTRLIVRLKNPQLNPPHSPYATSTKRIFKNYVVYYTKDVRMLKQDLERSPEVSKVEFNYKNMNKKQWPKISPILPQRINGEGGGTPEEPKNFPFNDPMMSSLWGLDESTQGVNLFKHLEYVTQQSLKKTPVVVAVVDTGVDVNHEDLKGKLWVNIKEIPNNGIDDDNNGYIDDLNGIDTLARDTQGRATAHRIDGHGHGTHVSGTIAAVQNNKIGIAGVSSHAKIMAIRTVPANGDETDVDVAESFIYAAKMGARIISCSFGKSQEENPGIVTDAINEVLKINETLVIASSGNDSQNIDNKFKFPASLPNNNLLVVNAIRKGGSLAMFSNYGILNTDLGAPGVSILSTTPKNGYQSWDGTSMATPHVTGVAAEILSLYPHLKAMELKEVLMKATKVQPSLQGKSVTGGSIDINLARQLASKIVSFGRRNIAQQQHRNSRF